MNLYNKSVGELAAQSEHSRMVLEKYDIDYCCHGKNSLDESCASKKVQVDVLISELEKTLEPLQNNPIHYELWSLPFLTNYIVENHHKYLRELLPHLTRMFDHVVDHHGQKFPELYKISSVYKACAESLFAHIFREEEELFSYVKRLTKLFEEGKHTTPPYFGSLVALENQFGSEHNATGNELALLRELTNNFTPPANSCKTQQRIYELLKDLYFDTKLHIHLENNILFPRALDLEKKVVVDPKLHIK